MYAMLARKTDLQSPNKVWYLGNPLWTELFGPFVAVRGLGVVMQAPTGQTRHCCLQGSQLKERCFLRFANLFAAIKKEIDFDIESCKTKIEPFYTTVRHDPTVPPTKKTLYD